MLSIHDIMQACSQGALGAALDLNLQRTFSPGILDYQESQERKDKRVMETSLRSTTIATMQSHSQILVTPVIPRVIWSNL